VANTPGDLRSKPIVQNHHFVTQVVFKSRMGQLLPSEKAWEENILEQVEDTNNFILGRD
jgi:hypothetical protein